MASSKADKIEITSENAHILVVKFLEILVEQNKVIISKLSEMNGLLGKIPAVDMPVLPDIGEEDGI